MEELIAMSLLTPACLCFTWHFLMDETPRLGPRESGSFLPQQNGSEDLEVKHRPAAAPPTTLSPLVSIGYSALCQV